MMVGHKEVVHRPAVGCDDALIAPLTAEDLVDQFVAGTAGIAAEAVVGGHHFLHVSLDHQVLESRQVGLAEVALRHFSIIAVTVPFRSGVDGIVFRTGMGFQDRGIRRALQAADHGHTQLAGQIRVLAVRLHPPPPARVAEDVDVRRPERDTLILTDESILPGNAVLHPCLVADGREYLIEKRLVKRSRHADGLREHRCGAVTGHPVQGLTPPVVCFDVQGGYRGGMVHGHGRLLLQGQAGHEVRRPLFG